MGHIIQQRKYAYAFSLILVCASIGMLSVWGLKLNSDFVGGTTLEFTVANDVAIDRDAVCTQLDGACDHHFAVTTQNVDNTKRVIITYQKSDEALNQKVLAAVQTIDENAQEVRVDFTGAVVSEQLKSNAVKAIIFSVIAILLYIAWAFRKVSVPVSSWFYGVGAVVALAHDVIITLGVFAFLGHMYHIEIGVPFVAALLTILGYSVNDTIVVYDRIRENVLRTRAIADFETLVNTSLRETIARSCNTSLTVVVVLIPILLFGGQSLFNFSLAMLVGVLFGTYSSIFIATALIVTIYMAQKNKKA